MTKISSLGLTLVKGSGSYKKKVTYLEDTYRNFLLRSDFFKMYLELSKELVSKVLTIKIG